MGEKAWKIGRHELQIEPPDIVFVRMVGDVTESETIGTPNTIRSMFCRTGSPILVGRRPRAWAHPSRGAKTGRELAAVYQALGNRRLRRWIHSASLRSLAAGRC